MPIDVNALCMSFLMFLNQQGTFDQLLTCPAIQITSVKHLQNMVCEGADCPAEAFYNLKEKTIYLSNELDLTHPVDKSVLLHELVHFAQDVTDTWLYHKESECLSFLKREMEAFRMQERYLLDNNILRRVGQQMAFYRC